MILQSLMEHYEALAEKGAIARPGWGKIRISYGLALAEDGSLLQVYPLKRDWYKMPLLLLTSR